MARIKDNLLVQGAQGAIGKELVYKKINGKTYAVKYPDMSRIEFNTLQKEYQNLFAAAITYARAVLNDPAQEAVYRKRVNNDKSLRGLSIYHAAIKDFMAKHSAKKPAAEIQKTLQQLRETYTLNDRQEKALKYLIAQRRLTNALYQQLNKVSKATATRDLQDLVRQAAISVRSRSAGACYRLAAEG